MQGKSKHLPGDGEENEGLATVFAMGVGGASTEESTESAAGQGWPAPKTEPFEATGTTVPVLGVFLSQRLSVLSLRVCAKRNAPGLRRM